MAQVTKKLPSLMPTNRNRQKMPEHDVDRFVTKCMDALQRNCCILWAIARRALTGEISRSYQ